MKKIVLMCVAGMSTGMLVVKMRQAAEELGIDCTINAYAAADGYDVCSSADLILLGPQIRYQIDEIKENFPGIPVDAIDAMDYGMMNGDKVMKFAVSLMECK
jgi:PTS system cellobiose-specific IIB component